LLLHISRRPVSPHPSQSGGTFRFRKADTVAGLSVNSMALRFLVAF
jgi:hypothetical protein